MNTVFLITKLIMDPRSFDTRTGEKAVKVNLELGKGVIDGIVLGDHKSGVVKLLYGKGDYIIVEGALSEYENKLILVIKDYFFFPLSQGDARSIIKGYRK